jgi:type III secretion protein L
VVGSYRLSELGYRLPAGTHILPKDAFEPVEAATGLLGAAEARAAEIVARAEEAFHARSLEGYQDGLAKAKLESVQRLLRESATLDASLREIEAEVARVVAACVRKLVADFDDYARAESVVRNALKQMRREKRPELRVAPAQFAEFKARIGAVVAEFPDIELVDVIEDATLVPPQVVLESRVGRVEADVAARLTELEEIVRSVAAANAEAA